VEEININLLHSAVIIRPIRFHFFNHFFAIIQSSHIIEVSCLLYLSDLVRRFINVYVHIEYRMINI
jgi:hypothetical protein